MSEIAVAQMRNRMLKETEGFLFKKLGSNRFKQRNLREEFINYIRRIEMKSPHIVFQPSTLGTMR